MVLKSALPAEQVLFLAIVAFDMAAAEPHQLRAL